MLREGGRSGRGPKCLYQIRRRGLLGQNWGITGAKIQFSPQNHPQNHPEINPGVGVCDSVVAVCHTTRTPRVHPEKFLFKTTPLSLYQGDEYSIY
jgi:hypothetical protein